MNYSSGADKYKSDQDLNFWNADMYGFIFSGDKPVHFSS